MSKIVTPGEMGITTCVHIWDAAWAQALKLPGFKTYRQAPLLQQTQPEELDLLACYMLSNDGIPDGNSTIGPVKLLEQVQIGFSGIIADSDSGSIHRRLAVYTSALDELLLRDPSFVRFDLFQGVERRAIKFQTGQVGQTPCSEFHYLITFSVRNVWEPVITDDFLTMHLETIFPLGETADEIAHTLQVRAVWDIPQN